jgi:hypothetical protein
MFLKEGRVEAKEWAMQQEQRCSAKAGIRSRALRIDLNDSKILDKTKPMFKCWVLVRI